MSEQLRCPICGEPTNIYMGKARKDRLCRKHGMQANKNEIQQCLDCGKWNEKDIICNCKTSNKNKNENLKILGNTTSNNNDEITCIICGEPSNNKHFCIKCWGKYKDKSIELRITNCKEIEILDQYGNLTIECDDGRRVRSRAEALISNFFYNNKIRSVYEKTIYYKEEGEDKTLHPDFYLPDYDIYIEYNEIKKKNYLNPNES